MFKVNSKDNILIYHINSKLLLKTLQRSQPSRYLFVQSQQYKNQNNERNLFKVNSRDTKTTSLTSFWCLYH